MMERKYYPGADFQGVLIISREASDAPLARCAPYPIIGRI